MVSRCGGNSGCLIRLRVNSATIPNAAGVESFDWVDGLIDKPLRIESGYAYPSDEPGWGFRFKESCLKEIKP